MKELDKISIGKRLADLRNKKAFTQKQVSIDTGIKQPNLAKYEVGDRSTSLPDLITLSEYYNVSIDYILTGISAENKNIYEATGLSENAIQTLENWNKGSKDIQRTFSEAYFFAKQSLELIFDTENVWTDGCCNHIGLNLLSSIFEYTTKNFEKELEDIKSYPLNDKKVTDALTTSILIESDKHRIIELINELRKIQYK